MDSAAQVPPQRLRSLDALRGFDMFWIIGGDWLLESITKLVKNDHFEAVSIQFTGHVDWEGFRFYDMIFPLFLFIIGATLPFSMGKHLESGEGKRALVRKVISRTLLLLLLGLIFNGLLKFEGWDHLRVFGVLQRQALGYCFAGLLYLFTKPRTQVIVGIVILLGYWALMAFAPVPGFPVGTFSPDGNFANYIDRLVLLPHQMYESYGDPEGLISTIPAFATAILGLLAGQWLKSDREGAKKALGLVACGAALIVLGCAWGPLFPIIKKIWTSSYVLVAGGLSMVLLGSFYWVIDVKGWSRWTLLFVVIGVNPIFIYMLSEIVDFGAVATYFVGGFAKQVPDFKDVIMGAGTLAAKWLLLLFLYRRKVFFKV